VVGSVHSYPFDEWVSADILFSAAVGQELQTAATTRGFVQRKIDCTCENKCEQLFAEREKFDYTRSAKHAVAAYEEPLAI
jgi:hypothetical protein